jgi:hypothetical protein
MAFVPVQCPQCHTTDVVQYGKQANGTQRLGRPKTVKKTRFSCLECGPRHHIPVPLPLPIRFGGA